MEWIYNNFWPVVFASVLFLTGIVVEIILQNRLKKKLAHWVHGNKLVQAFKWIAFINFSGLAVYVLVSNLELRPEIENYLEKSLLMTFVLTLTIITTRILTAYFNYQTTKSNTHVPTTSIFGNLIRFVVFSLGLVIMLQMMGISITPILTALGVGGIAVALALQDTLANLFAGITLIVSKSINIGDYIRLTTGEEGYVLDISWRTTIVKENSGNVVVVPNKNLSLATFKNYNLPAIPQLITVSIVVAHQNDLRKIEELILQSFAKVKTSLSILEEASEPIIRVQNPTEFGLQINIVIAVQEINDQGTVRHELLKELYDVLAKEKIEFPRGR